MINLIDPICVLDYGHNWGALETFGSAFAEHGKKVAFWVCSSFNRPTQFENIRRTLPHFYSLNGSPVPANYQEESDKNLGEVLSGLKEGEAVFLPGADGVSIQSLASLGLRRDYDFKFKHLVIRLIGVLENNFPDYHRMGLSDGNLRTIVDCWQKRGIAVSLYAETQTYAEALSGSVGFDVGVMPYPMQTSPSDCALGENERLIGFIGAARSDKGYFDILGIAEAFSKLRKKDEYFVVQQMSSEVDLSIEDYNNKLAKHKWVRFVPPILSDGAMNELTSSISVFGLPYDPGIYKFRGSAMLFEAASRGKAVVAYDELGFSRDILQFGLGTVSPAKADDFALGIRSVMDGKIQVDCSKFVQFSKLSLQKLVASL